MPRSNSKNNSKTKTSITDVVKYLDPQKNSSAHWEDGNNDAQQDNKFVITFNESEIPIEKKIYKAISKRYQRYPDQMTWLIDYKTEKTYKSKKISLTFQNKSDLDRLIKCLTTTMHQTISTKFMLPENPEWIDNNSKFSCCILTEKTFSGHNASYIGDKLSNFLHNNKIKKGINGIKVIKPYNQNCILIECKSKDDYQTLRRIYNGKQKGFKTTSAPQQNSPISSTTLTIEPNDNFIQQTSISAQSLFGDLSELDANLDLLATDPNLDLTFLEPSEPEITDGVFDTTFNLAKTTRDVTSSPLLGSGFFSNSSPQPQSNIVNSNISAITNLSQNPNLTPVANSNISAITILSDNYKPKHQDGIEEISFKKKT